MSARIKLITLATLLTALSVNGTAFAQNYFPAFPAAPEYRSNQSINRLKAKIPSNAFGSINDPTGASFDRPSNGVFFGGRAVGRDPDANVRLELLRDKDIGKY